MPTDDPKILAKIAVFDAEISAAIDKDDSGESGLHVFLSAALTVVVGHLAVLEIRVDELQKQAEQP